MPSLDTLLNDTKMAPYHDEITDLRRLLIQEQARVSLLREAVRLYVRDVLPAAQVMWARQGNTTPNKESIAEWAVVEGVIKDALAEGTK